MSKYLDIAGIRFNRLVAVSIVGIGPGRSALWTCNCDCGGSIITRGTFLRSGLSQSCGCLRKEKVSAANRARLLMHGETVGGNSRTYRIWANMISRCTNPNSDSYKYYGAKGIKVCEKWRKFSNFLDDMGRAIDSMSIDRVNCDGDYEPDNCRWATSYEQANNKRNSVFLILNGDTKTMSEWSRFTGISVSTIHSRLKKGWSTNDALTKPVRKLR